MARFKTALLFFTCRQSLPLGRGARGRPTHSARALRRQRQQLTCQNHSSEFSSVSSIKFKARVQVSFPSPILPSLCSLSTSCVFCAKARPPMPTYTFVECAHSQKFQRSLPSTGLWNFFCFLDPYPTFDSTVLAWRTMTCTIVPHTEYRFRDPIPCLSLLLLAWQLCFRMVVEP